MLGAGSNVRPKFSLKLTSIIEKVNHAMFPYIIRRMTLMIFMLFENAQNEISINAFKSLKERLMRCIISIVVTEQM
jgi:hypothetical protein